MEVLTKLTWGGLSRSETRFEIGLSVEDCDEIFLMSTMSIGDGVFVVVIYEADRQRSCWSALLARLGAYHISTE